MEVTIESVLKNKQKYNAYIKKTIQDRKMFMEQVKELRRNKESMSDEKDIARNEFEEAKLIQKISSLTNSFKSYKLTLEQLDLQLDALEGRIDKETYSKGMVDNRKAKMDLSKQDELEYCKDEVEKCKKAVKLYKLENDVEKTSEWEQALNETLKQLRDAQEELKTEEQYQEQTTEPDINESKDIIRPENDKKINENEQIPVNAQILNNSSLSDLDSQYIVELDEGTQSKIYYEARENGVFLEKYEYSLKDNLGDEIGYQTYSETYEPGKGETIIALAELEDKDGKYTISSVSEKNNNGSSYRKNVNGYNKRTGDNEQFEYTVDEQGNEFAYSKINGKIAHRVSKTSRGTVIEKYDENGQITDSYEYDKEGKAIIGFEGMDEIQEDYVEKFIERVGRNIPDYYAEAVDIGTHENKQQSPLKSAEEAIEESARTGTVNEQAQTIKTRQQERMNPNIYRDSNNKSLDD